MDLDAKLMKVKGNQITRSLGVILQEVLTLDGGRLDWLCGLT